jgi:hypothetical protein
MSPDRERAKIFYFSSTTALISPIAFPSKSCIVFSIAISRSLTSGVQSPTDFFDYGPREIFFSSKTGPPRWASSRQISDAASACSSAAASSRGGDGFQIIYEYGNNSEL